MFHLVGNKMLTQTKADALINLPKKNNSNESYNFPFPFLEDYNGQIVDCPHIHLYIEGYMDKWAIPISSSDFSDTKSLYKTLEDFFRYCNVVEPPKIYWRQTLNEFE